MPKGKTRKFIDKKNASTFHLVHRSQKDPLAADENAPQRVLVPAADPQSSKAHKKTLDARKREEREKFGIYFDDDYDYLQHLRDVNSLSVEWERVENPNAAKKKEAPKINLPSSVFASHVEEEVGLLNRAAPVSGPRLDWDPDIVAAMDEDFDYDDPDNQLEDDFILLANGEGGEDTFDENEEDEYNGDSENEESVSSNDMNVSDEENDEVRSLNGPQYTFRDEETRSRFTEYSMSSSVMRRNKQLSLLDDKFEHMYATYDDNEIGALDCDEIEGHIEPSSDLLLECAKEYEKSLNEDADNMAEIMKDRLKIINRGYSSSEDEEPLENLTVDPRDRNKWDCESVISSYSTCYNHPKLISEPKGSEKIKINSKTGIPKDVLGNSSGKLTKKILAKFDEANNASQYKGVESVAETMKSTLSILSIRPKDETPDERRDRKKALKAFRKERRSEKKANSEAFKDEKKRQEKILLNNRQNIQGNRIL